ncbi:MAG: SH3 domain-containing protein [Terasakiella sp.]|uniref:SH3 domain-containing protein n=1 Tax=unclassified Terasakiella TaxID=2614952 RepID=UPI003B002359
MTSKKIMTSILLISLIVLGVSSAVAQARSGSGLPLPRFVTLRAGEVNLRAGPGVRYPVEWVYKKRNLPVEVVAEYDTWRKIRDWQGTQGWVHQGMLSGKRSIIVMGDLRTLRREPKTSASPSARLEEGVIARLLECPQGTTWCKIDADGYEGWLRKAEFWGVYSEESLK